MTKRPQIRITLIDRKGPAVTALVRALAAAEQTIHGDAAAVGFADQSHLSRETRALLASTPGELFAFVQDALRPAH